jgi:hypothetical protein
VTTPPTYFFTEGEKRRTGEPNGPSANHSS